MNFEKEIENSIKKSAENILKSIEFSDQIDKSINLIINCYQNNNKVIIFGNGGSAADSQHMAAELIGRFKLERKSLPAIALTTDSSILTSLGNDYSYDVIFSRQCESLVSSGDVVIGISTSGNSKNVELAMITAQKKGAKTIGLLGNNGGNIKSKSDIPIIINSSDTANIQESHRVIYHIICELVERELSE
jgi:D-sedoheptulose 7-phosphate isomerase|tara:strand:+ start:364 stop:936 length:573 start_codon:yes stop_codon:yes gene_type:complete